MLILNLLSPQQEMLNLAASDAVNDYIVDRFDVSQVSAEQLKYMSLYAETGSALLACCLSLVSL